MSTFDAGSIAATLTLDRTPFVRDLKRAREQARRFSSKPINVPLDLDRTEFTRNLKNAREQLRKFSASRPTVNVTAEFEGKTALAQMEALRLKAADDINATVKADADTAVARAKLEHLKEEVNDLDHDNINIVARVKDKTARHKLSLLQSQLLATRSGATLLIGAIAGIGPAIAPVLVAGTGAVGAFSSALVAAGSGAAVVGASIVGNFMKIKEQTDLVTKARKKLRTATNPDDRKKAVKQLAEAKQHLAGLPGPIRTAAKAFLGMKKAWNDFLKATQGDAFKIIAQGLRIVSNLMPMMVPVFKAFSGVVLQILQAMNKWIQGPAFKRFLKFITTVGPPALLGFAKIAGNLATVFLEILQAFAPMADDMIAGLVKMTAGWAKWAAGLSKSKGFQKFMEQVRDLAPVVLDFFGSMAKAGVKLIEALVPFGTVVLKVFTAFFDYIAGMNPHILGAIVSGILGFVAVISILSGVMGFVAGAVSTLINLFGIFMVVIRGVAAVVGFLLSPIGLVIAAIALLVAGFIIAYKKSETFRNIVNGALSAVKNAAIAVAHWFAGPFVDFFVSAWNKVKGGAMALWHGLQAVWHGMKVGWNAVMGFFRAVYHNVLLPTFHGLKTAFMGVGKFFKAVWDGWIYPVFDLFRAIAKLVFHVVWGTIVGWVKKKWRELSVAMRAIYQSFIKPVFEDLASVAKWLWKNVLKPVFGYVRSSWEEVGHNAKWVWRHLIKPAWDAIKSAANWLWKHVLRPVFNSIKDAWHWVGKKFKSVVDDVIQGAINKFKTGIQDLKNKFKTAVDNIKTVWDRIKRIAKAPIKFVIGTVLNDGLISGFNKLASIFGTKKMSKIPMPFATGGFIPGSSPTPTADNIPILATAKEFMVRQRSARRAEQVLPGGLEYLNRTGMWPMMPGYANGGSIDFPEGGIKATGHADGGVWDSVKGAVTSVGGAIKNAASGAWGWVTDKLNPLSWVKKAVNGLLDKIPGAHMFTDLIKGGGKWVLSKAWDWAKGLFSFGGGDSGGSIGNYRPSAGVRQWIPQVRRALRMLHQPLSLVPAVLHRMQQESGGNPRAINLWDSNAAIGQASRGLMQTIPSTFAAYAGPLRGAGIYNPLANIYAGLNYAMHAYPSIRYAMLKPGGYASGGWIDDLPVFDRGGELAPGPNLVNNATGGREHLTRTDDLVPLLEELIRVTRARQSSLVGGDLVLQADEDDTVDDQFDKALFRLRTIGRV